MMTFNDEIMQEARRHFINGEYKMAENLLGQLVLGNAKNPEVFQMLGTIYYDQGQFNKAIRTFKRALEIDPNYTDASVGLSIILNDLGRYEEGRKIFEDAQSLLDKRKNQTDPYVDEMLSRKHEELFDLYYQYRRFKEAQEQILRAIRLSHRKPELTMKLADTLVALKDTNRAIKELKEVLKVSPKYVPGRLKLGFLYQQQGQFSDARDQWENVLKVDPKNKEAQILLDKIRTRISL